jgi:hypothetical protein
MQSFSSWVEWGHVAYTLDFRYSHRKKSGCQVHRMQWPMNIAKSYTLEPSKHSSKETYALPCSVGHCTILLKPYISHTFPHPLQFCSQKCSQYNVITLGIHGNGLVALYQTRKHHTKWLLVQRGFLWIRIEFLSSYHLKFCLFHNQTSGTGPNLTWSKYSKPVP